MQKYKLFEKTMTPLQRKSQGMNGAYSDSGARSPTDDPLDGLARARSELKSVSDDEEDTGQFDVSKAGISGKGMPRWAMGLFGAAVALALLVVAIGWAIAYAKR